MPRPTPRSRITTACCRSTRVRGVMRYYQKRRLPWREHLSLMTLLRRHMPYLLISIPTTYDWDWGRGDQEFHRALQLNPNDAAVRHRYSRYLSTLGRTDEALREIKHEQELDPLSQVAKANVGLSYYFARQYDLAIKPLNDVLKEDPTFDTAFWGLGLIYEQKGMPAEAVAQMGKAGALSPDPNTMSSLAHAYAVAGQKEKAQKILGQLDTQSKKESISGYQFAVIYAGLGEHNKALAELEKAFKERSSLLGVYQNGSQIRSHPLRHALHRYSATHRPG